MTLSPYWTDASETEVAVPHNGVWARVAARREANGAVTVRGLGDAASVLGAWLRSNRLPSWEEANAPHAEQVVRAFEAKCVEALGSTQRQMSVSRYIDTINIRVISGGDPITTEEQADIDMVASIDAWETEMIAAREAAIAAGTPVHEITWPAPPAGLPAFLVAF